MPIPGLDMANMANNLQALAKMQATGNLPTDLNAAQQALQNMMKSMSSGGGAGNGMSSGLDLDKLNPVGDEDGGRGKGKGKKGKSRRDKNDELTVVVKGLDYNVDEDTLRQDFSQCGEVVRVNILGNKGIAFVQYKDAEGHAKALEWSGTWYKGRSLTVKKASE